jgi:hypothetical protein
MEIEVKLNPRGNGACPICGQNGVCRVQSSLLNAIEKFSSEDDPIELVVYSCPYFQEKL